MSKRAMMTMVRRNPVTSRMAWITGLAVGGLALVGGVAYAVTRGGGTSSTTFSANTLPNVLKHGERYRFSASAPAGSSTLTSALTKDSVQAMFDQAAPGEFKVAEFAVATPANAPAIAAMLVDVVGPDYAMPPLTATQLAALATQKVTFQVTDMGATPANVPDITVNGPYNVATQMQVGETYLVSLAPIAGQTLAQAVQNLTSASGGMYSVSQSWDVGQVPASWPSSDSSPNEWRMVITYASGTGPQSPSGFNLFTTAGASA